jgi:hypothetical protein
MFDFFAIPFYLHYVLVRSGNIVKTCIQWHVEERSVVTSKFKEFCGFWEYKTY